MQQLDTHSLIISPVYPIPTVSLISSLIFRLKYAILFWNKMVEYLHRKERK